MKYDRYIYLCRHGLRDDDNPANERYDPGLSSLGIAQVKLLAKTLSKFDISTFYSSPYRRTLETSEYIAFKLDMTYSVDYFFAEWLNPEWMDCIPKLVNKEDIQKKYKYANILTSFYSDCIYSYPESVSQLTDRVQKATELIRKLDGNVLIITHGTILTQLAACLTGIETSFFKWDICCLTSLGYIASGDRWDIILNGSLEHMRKYVKFLY